MNGRRSAATIGGSSALRIAITSAATSAPPKLSTDASGTIVAATSNAAAETIQARRTRKGRICGRPGLQAGRSPYAGWLVCVVIGSHTLPRRGRQARASAYGATS